METRREEIDPFEGIDDPTLRVQMQHEMRAIEELVFVTKLSFVPAHKDKAQGFRATLSCALCRWYDSCGKGQEQAVQLSRERTTLLACLQELRKRLQDRHGFRCAEAVAKKAAADAVSAATVNPDAPNVLDAMVQLEQVRTRAKAANKLALDAEKEKDAAEQEVQRLQQLLQAKRARTHATTANDHEECDKKSSDDMDLADHRREATRIQNRRSIPLGSRGEVPTPQEGKAGPWSILAWGLWDGLRTGVLATVCLLSKSL
jgi:hypothetical protein